ncbi:uncharacterized protein [Dysidea avara]|uniref:uncharacterized protein n=1 Tax=Dysidea avara TaxID=196820 RepID=UPI003320987F
MATTLHSLVVLLFVYYKVVTARDCETINSTIHQDGNCSTLWSGVTIHTIGLSSIQNIHDACMSRPCVNHMHRFISLCNNQPENFDTYFELACILNDLNNFTCLHGYNEYTGQSGPLFSSCAGVLNNNNDPCTDECRQRLQSVKEEFGCCFIHHITANAKIDGDFNAQNAISALQRLYRRCDITSPGKCPQGSGYIAKAFGTITLMFLGILTLLI